MTGERSEAERLRTIVADRFGLSIDESKLLELDELLSRQARASGCTRAACLSLLDDVEGDAERRALAQQLTVSETFFFRQNEQLQMLAEVLAGKARGMPAPRLRILSAGCASGEEPFSLAMLLKDRLAGTPCDLVIRAVDVSAAALARARRGRYGPWSLREAPPELVRRYFTPEGSEHVLDPQLRKGVKLEERNLIEDHAELFQPDSYDAVLCRNVLMYFTRDAARVTVARIARALVSDGYLVLGYAETLRDLSHDFHLRHTHGTFYYQKRGAPEQREPEQRAYFHEAPLAIASVSAVLPAPDGWFDAIAQSTERVRALSQPALQRKQASARRAPAPIDDAAPTRAPGLEPVLDLLHEERFGEALAALEQLGSSFEHHPDVLLLRAVALTHSGQLDAAMQTCRALLEDDELHAGAHYLLALCYEGQGNGELLREHDQIAVYLDPSFAMPRLHLGLAARRAGDRASAQRELTQALPLLEREGHERLRLFAVGWPRAALIGLCRAELAACGGAS